MNESTTKRRIWIRNIIIILLIILLILTLFSNTILESSLPEVSVSYPQYASVSSRIRATSTVTSKDSLNVTATQTRSVVSVDARVGQRVEKGDVLMTLKAGDSAEVQTALNELTNLRIQLIQKKKADPALAGTTATATMKSLQTQLKAAKADLNNAYADLNEMRKDLATLQQELEEIRRKQDQLPTPDEILQAENVIALAKSSIEAYDEEIARLQGRQGAIGGDGFLTPDELAGKRQDALYELELAERNYAAAMAARDNAKLTVALWQDRVKTAQASYDKTTETLTEYTASMKNGGITEASLISEQQSLADKQNAITQARQYFSQNDYLAARQAYFNAKSAYDSQYHSASLTDEQKAALKKALDDALAVYQPLDTQYQSIASQEQAFLLAQQTYQQHYQQYMQSLQENSILKQLTDAQKSAKADLASMQESLEGAKETQTQKQTEYEEAVKKYDEAKANLAKYDGYQEYDALRDEIKELKSLKADEEKKIADAQKIVDSAKDENKKAVSNEISAKEKEISQKNKEITNQSKTINSAQDNVNSIQAQIDEEDAKTEAKELSGALDEEQYALEMQQIEDSIAKKEEQIEKLRALAEELTITAPAGGVIESISAVVGREVQANATVCVISLAENGYTMQTTVTAQQAARISVGDTAELQWYYRGDQPALVVTSISTDPQSQGRNKIVTLSVTGENIQPGQQLTFSLGNKGQSYDCVVPNSAVREDANGKFVLIVSAKSTPLGTRYTAKRADVEVIAADDTKSAISSSVQGEYVITNSSVPISAGMQVRLSDTNS